MPSLRVIEIAGPSARERGRQYGTAAADLIADIEQALGGMQQPF